MVSGLKITLNVQIGSYFTIPVGLQLTLKNIVFNFQDSLVEDKNLPCASLRSEKCVVHYNELTDTVEMTSRFYDCPCKMPEMQASKSNFNHPLALFNSLSSSSYNSIIPTLTL